MICTTHTLEILRADKLCDNTRGTDSFFMTWLWLQRRGRSERLTGNEFADQEDGVAASIGENEGETRNNVPHAAPAHPNTPGDEKV